MCVWCQHSWCRPNWASECQGLGAHSGHRMFHCRWLHDLAMFAAGLQTCFTICAVMGNISICIWQVAQLSIAHDFSSCPSPRETSPNAWNGSHACACWGVPHLIRSPWRPNAFSAIRLAAEQINQSGKETRCYVVTQVQAGDAAAARGVLARPSSHGAG